MPRIDQSKFHEEAVLLAALRTGLGADLQMSYDTTERLVLFFPHAIEDGAFEMTHVGSFTVERFQVNDTWYIKIHLGDVLKEPCRSVVPSCEHRPGGQGTPDTCFL